mgnify:FL=1
MSCCRPLKCVFCSRKFKYQACMIDHIRTDHMEAVTHKLQQIRQRKIQIALQQIKKYNQIKPVKVSVIKRNHFHLCKSQA